MSVVIVILCAIAAVLAVTMLFAKSPITSALSLLGILILTAAIYGLIGEHMVATIQLIVYAGAIMVLFIFSIMLLNLNNANDDYKRTPAIFAGSIVMGLGIFGFIAYGIKQFYAQDAAGRTLGFFSPEVITYLGGNSKVVSHALFSQFYVSFEVISLALLVAIVGAVVLAKRKVD